MMTVDEKLQEIQAQLTEVFAKVRLEERALALKDREALLKQQGDWKARWYELRKLLWSRMVFDEKARKAWMVAGDFELLQEFMKQVEKQEGRVGDIVRGKVVEE